MPLLRNPVLALKTTLCSSAARADVTISFARHTVLIEDKERFEARRWNTRVSRVMSCCAIERDWELDGESEAWERLMGGEADMVQTMMCF
jgi:phosphohistidine phosphatase SixA